MSLSSCEHRSNCVTVFKGVTTVISVGKTDRYSFREDFNDTETPKNQKNALWWHCLDRSGVIKLLQCRNFCAMSKQRWYCFGTLHLTQCATFITNVKSSVRHSQFLWGESIETKLVCRNNNNCDLRGLANFERATYLNLLILIRIGHTNFHFWVYYLAFLLYVDIGKSL